MSPRADARRNRARILAEAEAVFAADGLSASTEEIARRAGVGAGTMFRHFPTKNALAEAVIMERLERLVAQARTLEGDDAFFAYFSDLVDNARLNAALRDALTGEMSPAMNEVKRQLDEVGRALLQRAQEAGVVRDDIGAADVRALLHGCLAMERVAEGPPGRLTALVSDALRRRSPARSGSRRQERRM
jgi:AcrR family transcriptional regulator